MTTVFIFLAYAAAIGLLYNARRRNGHMMVYSAFVCALWLLAALWWSGRIG